MKYNIDMSFVNDDYYQEKFNHISLTGEIVKSRVFDECEFTTCSFIDCKFDNSKFLNCRFTECVLSAVVPMNCRFNNSHFLKCKVIGIDWTKAQQIRELDFMESQINYSSFKLLNIPKTRIVKCEAKEVDFTETDLSQGDFKNTDFENSRFFKTNLSYADFRDAKNYYIDTGNNILKQTRFSLPEALSLLNSLDIILD
jgi:fluoroquinolone resistance protein